MTEIESKYFKAVEYIGGVDASLNVWRIVIAKWLAKEELDILSEKHRKPKIRGAVAVKSESNNPNYRVGHGMKARKDFIGHFIFRFLMAKDEHGNHPYRRYWASPLGLTLKTNEIASNEFWELVCEDIFKEYETKGGRIVKRWTTGHTYSVYVNSLLEFAIKDLTPELTNAERKKLYKVPFEARTIEGSLKNKPTPKNYDKEFTWILAAYPYLAAWVPLFKDCIRSQREAIPPKLQGIIKFVQGYLVPSYESGKYVARDIACDPGLFFLRKSKVENNLHTIFPISTMGAHDAAVECLNWILTNRFTVPDDDGNELVPYEFRNPFLRKGRPNYGKDESVYSPLPYGYIDRMREILVEGPYFRDWKWAQSCRDGKGGHNIDWFPVDPSLIDRNDPNCVWREREAGPVNNRVVLTELWSPVRWVAQLVRLILPVRVLQARVLDSGEADGERWEGERTAEGYPDSPWVENYVARTLQKGVAATASGKGNQTVAQGVLRKAMVWSELDSQDKAQRLVEVTLVYINTNKTADNRKKGAAKGFQVPWPVLPWPLTRDGQRPQHKTSAAERRWLADVSKNLHYWLATLRDWQTKYNPVKCLTTWKELEEGKIIPAKSDEQLVHFNSGVFLFRDPAFSGSRSAPQEELEKRARLPITSGVFLRAWGKLLHELQHRLEKEGVRNSDGSLVKLRKVCTNER